MQISDFGNPEENAHAVDFKDAIGRDEAGQLYVVNPNLDVEYMERYQTFTYEMQPLGYGIKCDMVVRMCDQYSRRISKGHFSSVREITEVRLVPEMKPLLDSATMENALDTLWTEAFNISNGLKCKTQ